MSAKAARPEAGARPGERSAEGGTIATGGTATGGAAGGEDGGGSGTTSTGGTDPTGGTSAGGEGGAAGNPTGSCIFGGDDDGAGGEGGAPVLPPGITVRTSPYVGKYLADATGRALYTWGGDLPGDCRTDPVSRCAMGCSPAWPGFNNAGSLPVEVSEDLVGSIPGPVTSPMSTYYGWPLYYYAQDMLDTTTMVWSIRGQGVGRVWHLAKLVPSNVVMMKAGTLLYLGDQLGMTLYTYSEDTVGTNPVSDCTGACLDDVRAVHGRNAFARLVTRAQRFSPVRPSRLGRAAGRVQGRAALPSPRRSEVRRSTRRCRSRVHRRTPMSDLVHRVRFVGIALFATVTLSSTTSLAETGAASSAAAEALFEDAVKLVEAKDFSAACEKFKASQELDPALGTLLRLADCYDRDGKTASAWATFKEVSSLAEQRGQVDRKRMADERVTDLETRLSRLELRVAVKDPPKGFEIQLNGVTVPKASYNAALPVDPGLQEVRALAPGHEPWTGSIDVPKGPADAGLDVPALKLAPKKASDRDRRAGSRKRWFDATGHRLRHGRRGHRVAGGERGPRVSRPFAARTVARRVPESTIRMPALPKASSCATTR